jgi:hypothetical protein
VRRCCDSVRAFVTPPLLFPMRTVTLCLRVSFECAHTVRNERRDCGCAGSVADLNVNIHEPFFPPAHHQSFIAIAIASQTQVVEHHRHYAHGDEADRQIRAVLDGQVDVEKKVDLGTRFVEHRRALGAVRACACVR